MSDKSILITGCSSGIGYQVAHDLHRDGWQVMATCRAQADVDRLTKEGLTSFRLDYSDPSSVSQGAARALDNTGGRLFALFNNGAFAIPGAVEDLPGDALREVFEVNVFGQFDLIRAVLPAMRRSGRGRIINNSSFLGFVAMPFRGSYVGSKFALEGLTHTLRQELRGTDIHVSLIQPGPVSSRIRENSAPHFKRWIDWKASAQRSVYEAHVLPWLEADETAPVRFQRPPSAVTPKLRHALTARKPRARYFVTPVPWIVDTLRRVLPARQMDYILSRR